MEEHEYMKIHSKYFSDELNRRYNIQQKIAPDNYVYCKIKKGMYGLKQAARLAYDDLVLHLKNYGYYPDKICQNIWSHKTRKTKFCLCVDDFRVKFFNEVDKEHLCNALKQKYEITTDMSGKIFCGLTLDWNYTYGYVDVSMPNFVQKNIR